MNDRSCTSNQDWRLMGQERFLQAVKLYWRKHTRYNETWDHDHCEFCGAKFMVEDYPDVLHEGYSTENQYYWICEKCFEDLKEKFQWEVAESRSENSDDASQQPLCLTRAFGAPLYRGFFACVWNDCLVGSSGSVGVSR
jgi:hypothetical protein